MSLHIIIYEAAAELPMPAALRHFDAADAALSLFSLRDDAAITRAAPLCA